MSKKKPALPQMPIFTPAPAYTPPPAPQAVVPPVMSAPQVVTAGNEAEALLPQHLQLTANPLDAGLRQQYEDAFYAQYVRPQIADAEANLYRNGQSYGSYGGALLGQMQAQGALSKFQAGLENAQQQYNNLLAGRQSYFAGGPGIAQNQNQQDVGRGLGISQIQTNQANALNNYNLAQNDALNSMALQNYNLAMNQYNTRQAQQQQRSLGFGLLGLGAGQMLGKGIGALMSRPVQTAAPAAPSNPFTSGSLGNSWLTRFI